MKRGRIVGIVDHGTIISVIIESPRDEIVALNFDHTPFRWMFEARQARILGCEVDYDLNGPDGPVLGFADELGET